MSAQSIHTSYIEQYLAVKKAQGCQTRTIAAILRQFDRQLCAGVNTTGITAAMMDIWCQKRPNETVANQSARIMHICQYARFLSSLGIAAYIPRVPRFKSSFTPYIFSQEQLTSIFNACDRFVPYKASYNSAYGMMPALLRLLYGTGLRLGEALTLSDKDVNLQDKYIIVRESKNGTDRMVPLSDSLVSACIQYKNHKEAIKTKPATSGLFFVKNDQRPCSSGTAYAFFRQVLNRAGIAHQGRGMGPRLHDLRHTFACHSLQAMSESGMDPYHALPILSTYLGHRSLTATDKYVRMTSELYTDVLNKVNQAFGTIFPDLQNDTYLP